MAAKRQSSSEPAAVKTIPGVDVSSFQGAPSSWQAAAGNVKWVAVKLTELQPNNVPFVNTDAAKDWAFVGGKKLGRIAYMFGHPSESPEDSVALFANELGKLGLRDTDGLMLDLEVTDGLQPAAVSAWGTAVMADLHTQFNRTPFLYTFINFAKEGNTEGLGKYPLWISDPSSPAGHPVVPAPWKDWTIHQYSTSAPIDRDVAKFATVAAMQKAMGAPPAPPPPEHGDLDGRIATGVTAIRWSDGSMVIAGLNHVDHVAIRRFDGATRKWGVWWNPVGTVKAAGPPGLVSWGESFGQLFYATQDGHVHEVGTEDKGKSWQ
jgi:GH25 family lysozyme M1 (1,4-beta-N-acetylmuramidase)